MSHGAFLSWIQRSCRCADVCCAWTIITLVTYDDMLWPVLRVSIVRHWIDSNLAGARFCKILARCHSSCHMLSPTSLKSSKSGRRVLLLGRLKFMAEIFATNLRDCLGNKTVQLAPEPDIACLSQKCMEVWCWLMLTHVDSSWLILTVDFFVRNSRLELEDLGVCLHYLLALFLTKAISMKYTRGFPAWASRVLSSDENARLEDWKSLGYIRIRKDQHRCTKLQKASLKRRAEQSNFILFQGLPSWLPLQLWQRAHAWRFHPSWPLWVSAEVRVSSPVWTSQPTRHKLNQFVKFLYKIVSSHGEKIWNPIAA